MLNVTENAAQAMEHLLGDRPGAGLRIAPDRGDTSAPVLGITISDRPQDGDEVIEQAGWRVFVDDEVAPALDGRVLDARIDEDMALQFSLVQP